MKRAVLYADGACRGNPGPAGSGAALETEDGHVVAEAMRYLGHGTNNIAEYTALIIGLEEAWRHEVEDIEIRPPALPTSPCTAFSSISSPSGVEVPWALM